jgi:tight adherence protein C
MSATALLAASAAACACGCFSAGCRGMVGSGPALGERASVIVATRPVPRRSRRDRKQRAAEWRGEIPQFLDLLAAGSTAGLSAEISFRQAASSLHGPLGGDLADVMRSVDLGVPWREALAAYVERTGDLDLARMASVLARTEALGVSLRDATRDLAGTVREARRAATLERARTAPVRMLFPLVFMILPAFLLLTVVPVLITTVRSIR